MTPLELVLSKLPDARRSGKGWIALCPAHDDTKPSLSVAEGDDGRVLIHCHAGCAAEAVVRALRLIMADLMPPDRSRPAARRRWPLARRGGGNGVAFDTLAEAVAATAQAVGRAVAQWRYNETFYTVRFERDGAKTYRPMSRGDDSRWRVRFPPEPLPLYALEHLPQSGPVVVVEGERCADWARGLGLAAVTSAGGASAARKADWRPLAGRDVPILPDANEAGKRYARDVTSILTRLDPPARVRIAELPGLPAGGDIVDYAVANRERFPADLRAEIAALVQKAHVVPVWTSEEVGLDVPLEFRPFPSDALPEPLRAFVVEGATALGCDPAFIALPILAACGAAVGNSRVLQLKRGWVEPPVFWTVLVGESGTVKSPALDLALGAVEQRQCAAFARHAVAVEVWQMERQQYEVAVTAWKRARGQGAPPEEPKQPVCERLRVDDLTVEALAVLLADNPRGLLVARDELAQWFGGFDRYAQRRGGDAPAWLRMHYARSLIIDRKTGDRRTIYVPRAAVCLTGGIQPGMLRRALGQEHEDDGLAARLLFALPPRPVRQWSEAEVRPGLVEIVERVFEHLYALMPQAVEEDGGWVPAIINLGPEAKEGFKAFYNEHGAEQRELVGTLAAAWSKLEAYAARLALIVHCVRVADGEPGLDPFVLDAASIEAGVRLVRWFGNEARRVYGLLHEDPTERKHRELVELIERRGGAISVRELMRASRAYPQAEDAGAALDALVEAGLGRWETVKPGPQGGRPSRCFSLAKRGADNTDC